MVQLIQTLLNDINQDIVTNNAQQITATKVNRLMKNMTDTLAGSNFTFPKGEFLTEDHIGRVVMNKDGVAQLYQLSPAVPEQLGRWIIKIDDLGDLADNSTITVETSNNLDSFTRILWRNGAIPATTIEELNLIKAYLDTHAQYAILNATIVTDTLVIEENAYNATQISLSNFPGDGSSYIDTISRPALPEAPSSFPLGKLVGVEGNLAIISSNAVEVYELVTPITINNSFFDANADIDLVNLYDLAESLEVHIILPDSDGKVAPLNLGNFQYNNSFRSTLRHHFLGIAIASDGPTVTVINTIAISFILNLFIKFTRKSIGKD